jgi:hypothetical protein
MLKIQLRHSTDDIILYSLGNTHDKSSLPEEKLLLSSGVADRKSRRSYHSSPGINLYPAATLHNSQSSESFCTKNLEKEFRAWGIPPEV